MKISRITKIKDWIKAFRILLRNEVNRMAVKRNPMIAIKSLQDQGVDIADDVVYFGDDIEIDLTRPSLIHIGSKTFLHNHLKILTHDYASYVFINKYH